MSGLVVTWQGLYSIRLDSLWDILHLVSSLIFSVFVVLHLTTLIFRKFGRLGPGVELLSARRKFYLNSFLGFGILTGLCVLALLSAQDVQEFKKRFEQPQAANVGVFTVVKNSLEGLQKPNEQKLAKIFDDFANEIQQRGELTAKAMANSASCGSSNCHSQIYQEWLPSAHRYSAMDDMFQQVQTLMVEETSAEHTRYCAGCHDPISLFSGAKNASNITLSAQGSDEGSSCMVCHSITKTDIQGNGNYVVKAPRRYLFELDDDYTKGGLKKTISDFLIRTYPRQHLQSFSRALYKTAEFCGACHKQYLDKEVNTDIGKVQGQNQYDNWKNSRWSKDSLKDSTTCRECHMPLIESQDPARGDILDYNRTANDGKHRSHRTLGTNQYIPQLHQLKGQKTHTELTEKWMRGEIEIPEIANKWKAGAAMQIEVQIDDSVTAGEQVNLSVHILNNKAGHDFPTGPMDMIQSWLEVKVSDEQGQHIYHGGYLDETGRVQGLPVLYRADGFDRQGQLINRHNLWDLVGASYKRTLFPGMSDNIKVPFKIPENTQGNTITVEVSLQYRKANPEFLDRVYGKDKNVRTPITTIAKVSKILTLKK